MEEPKQEYFKKSLSDFTFDMASGGAIRHLADRGYTVEQIVKMLDFPTPYDRVRQTVWKYFLDKGTVLLKEPEREAEEEKYGYVTDYDMFGRKSFRRVVVKERSSETIQWRESRYGQTDSKRLLDFLGKKSMENGEDFSYVSCEFGLLSKKDPKEYERLLEVLNPQEREYILGIPWERKTAYHRLDDRMQKITVRLWEAGAFRVCYFMKTREKIQL
ncbi:MAG: hypothetical protein HFG53_09295 [Lachnospiraceae bacterium]|nr:hypothetical protein [Lachnospiraceae bacterium]